MKTIKSLYIVDDDKIYHFLFKNLLKQNGIDVETTFFCNGLDAIEFIRKSKDEVEMPDLILLDVNMPIMNGWQFLEEYEKLVSGFVKKPVIYMISSSNNEVDIIKSKDFEGIVKDYYLKPICREDLEKMFVLEEV
jgi:CheY-like chemotaxis protein